MMTAIYSLKDIYKMACEGRTVINVCVELINKHIQAYQIAAMLKSVYKIVKQPNRKRTKYLCGFLLLNRSLLCSMKQHITKWKSMLR